MKLLADPVITPNSAPVDLTGYAKTTDLNDYAKRVDLTTKAEISPIFDLLPVPTPLAQQPTIPNLGALVANAVGTQMVNAGKLHSFGRTSTPPQMTWDSTFNVSPASTPCKLRFAVASAKQSTAGGIEVSINGATALTASNTGGGWSSPDQSLAVYVDGGWTWFEVAISAQATAIPVRVQLPTGQGAIPTLYRSDAITSLTPAAPTGLRLISMPSGQELPYRPAQLAAKADIPSPYDAAPLTARVVALESRPLPNVARLVAWATDGNLTTQMNAAHPAGGTFKSYLLASEGNACDFTIGNNITASAFKTELGVPQTHRLARVKSGLMDALIDNASNIPSGIYRVYVTGDLVRMIALESADPVTTTTLATGLVSGLTYSTSSSAFVDIAGAALTVPSNTKAVIGYQVTPNRVAAGQTRFRIVDSAGAAVPDTLGAAPTFTSNYDAATVTVDAEVTTGASAVTYKLQVLSNNSSATSNAATGVNKFYYRQLR